MNESNYLRSRTVTEFLEWIDTTNLNRLANDQSNAYRAREGLWKKYADEAEPLGRFLRGNGNIDKTGIIQMGLQSDTPDAILTSTDVTINFEITTTDHVGAVHNRNQLNEHDFGPGDGITPKVVKAEI